MVENGGIMSYVEPRLWINNEEIGEVTDFTWSANDATLREFNRNIVNEPVSFDHIQTRAFKGSQLSNIKEQKITQPGQLNKGDTIKYYNGCTLKEAIVINLNKKTMKGLVLNEKKEKLKIHFEEGWFLDQICMSDIRELFTGDVSSYIGSNTTKYIHEGTAGYIGLPYTVNVAEGNEDNTLNATITYTPPTTADNINVSFNTTTMGE